MHNPFARVFGAPHWPTVILTYALGAAGGLTAKALHLPLPMLLGSLLAVGAAAITGARPFGHLPQAPQGLRMLFVPVIGVAIGGAVRPGIVAEAAGWLPSLAALCVFIPLVHYAGYRMLLASGRTDRITAFYGSAPGGLVETVQMGEEAGADVAMLAMLQFLRLILIIVLVPLAFTWMEGHAVGSAGGAAVGGQVAIGPGDVVILAVAAVAGALIGLRLRLPAGHVLGPVILSGAAHGMGWTAAVPPGWLIATTQVVIGTALGVRFAGMPKRRDPRCAAPGADQCGDHHRRGGRLRLRRGAGGGRAGAGGVSGLRAGRAGRNGADRAQPEDVDPLRHRASPLADRAGGQFRPRIRRADGAGLTARRPARTGIPGHSPHPESASSDCC